MSVVAAQLISKIDADDKNFHTAMDRAHAKVSETEGKYKDFLKRASDEASISKDDERFE